MSEEALKPVNDQIVRLMVENHARFRKFLAKRVGSLSIADDLLQQSLKKAIETPADAKSESSIVAWLYKILRNTLTDHYRAQGTEQRKYQEFSSENFREMTVHPPDELGATICACFKDLLPTLKDSYAEVLNRVDLEGETLSNVAKSLGVTENNLTVRLHRARQALKTSLVKTCGTCTEHGCLDCTCH